MLRRIALALVLLVAAIGLAACGGDDAADATTRISVAGTDNLRFDPDVFTVPAGQQVTVELTAEPAVEHDFVIEDANGGDLDVVFAEAGQTATGTFTIDEAGTYTVYCSIPGHRTAGMEAELRVVDAG
jgi:uncharacterized cupredoxin-like copper-binding protein